MTAQNRGLATSGWRLAAYASPAIPISTLMVPMAIFLPPFYATEMGLGLAAVGAIFFATRLWDMVTDPVLGVISDKVPSRWGRRRHWLVLSVPILMISVVLVFFPQTVLSGPASWVYLTSGFVLLYIGFTFAMVSHTAWGAELSDDYDERSRIQGWREFALQVGMFLVLAVPAYLEQTGQAASAALKVEAMGWFVLLLLPPTVALAVWAMPERATVAAEPIGWRRATEIVLKNKLMMRILAADLMLAVPGAVRSALYVFFVMQIVQAGEWLSLLLISYTAAALIAVPFWVVVARRVSKHRAVAYGVLGHMAVTVGYLMVGEGDALFFAGLFFLSGLVYGGTPFLLRAITADITDADALESGEQRSGLYFALITMVNKGGYALGIFLSYPLLQFIGFDPAGANSAEALNGLVYTFVFIPVVAEIAVFLLLYNFPLGREKQQELQTELDRKGDALPL